MNKIFKGSFVLNGRALEALKYFLECNFDEMEVKEEYRGIGTCLSVPIESYKDVLMQGKSFLNEQKLTNNAWWLNHYDELVKCDITTLACAIHKKREINDRGLIWSSNNIFLPNDIKSYFKALSKFLKQEIIRENYYIEKAYCLQTRNINYDYQVELLKKFILDTGYGPFNTIKKVAVTGEIFDEEYPVLTK